jgi:hypothetical protein
MGVLGAGITAFKRWGPTVRSVWLALAAVAVTAAVIGTLVQPVDAAKARKAAAISAAKELATTPVIQRKFPELAAFGKALAAGRSANALRIGQDIVAHPARTDAEADAVLHSPEYRRPSGTAAGRFGRLAVVNPVASQLRPQIDIGALIRSIVCPILNALASGPFGAFFGPVINALKAAFGCNPPPPPTTTTTTTTTTTPSSTTTTSTSTSTTTTSTSSTTSTSTSSTSTSTSTTTCTTINPC